MKLDARKVLPIGLAAILAWFLGVAFGYINALGLGPLSVALFAVGVIVFFGTLRAGADMRTAITAAFVTLYFAFLAALSTSDINRAQFDTTVGQELWDNFTYLVGAVVLFYFGATAATEITHAIKNAPNGGGASGSGASPPTGGDASTTTAGGGTAAGTPSG